MKDYEQKNQTLKDLMIEIKNSGNNCIICTERAQTKAVQPCGHAFCELCGLRAVEQKKCLTCIKPVTHMTNVQIQSYVADDAVFVDKGKI